MTETSRPARTRRSVWLERHRRPVGLAAIAIALGLAALWLVVVPGKAESSTGVTSWLLRFGHSLCWVLLAATAALWAARAPRRALDLAAWAALAAYGGFLLALWL
ncbi:hypothetical protein [Yonghaparkia sp. Soil809]|uniref:hypothetical protein n=1 Tax=Yonghaparkia sp. Soil809 TaxID=1736417 RepID=UPI0006FCCCAC|nr:hypothetical protein [Yonghaparkia sp. Soil809]KRF33394.1 hypothetical protein ASG83_05505 [Yonghaparkia sp. Soil809]